jgi:hypothetical protein
MKISNIIFGFLLLGLLFEAKAQNALFNVLASKGNVKYVAGGTTDEKTMVIGKKLFPTDKIVVGEASYLGLAHSGGKTIEIKRAGTYEVAKLASEVANQNASVSKKYVDFLAGEINNNGQDMAKNKYKYMGVTGSVERGGSDITIYAPKEAYVLNGPVTIKWDARDDVKTYTVKLMNIFDEVLYTTETTSPSVTLDLTPYNLPKEKNLFLVVSSKEDSNIDTEKINLKSLEAKDAEVSKQASDLKAELSEPTALNKFVLASFYAEQGLIINAVEQYEAAVALEPEVEDYKVAYGEYLVKTQIKKVK